MPLQKYSMLSLYIIIVGSFLVANGQNAHNYSTNYKNWSLEQFRNQLDSDSTDVETNNIYIENYLQKAKKAKSEIDIVKAYQKKILFTENYNLKIKYADSLLNYALNSNNKLHIGNAYDYKKFVEFQEKNYEKALEYGLLAEKYLTEEKDYFTLNLVKGAIGAIYYHLEDYEKSEKLFKEAVNYYRKDTTYDGIRNFTYSSYSLSKASFKLEKNDTLPILINHGYTVLQKLNDEDRAFTKSYFDLVNGMYNYRMMNFFKSESLLKNTLSQFIKNGDFANEHLVYLYLGKNAVKENKRELALNYFKKIDKLYRDKKFINVELSEAYEYLIDYYRDIHDIQNQLYYTNILLQISSDLHKNNTKLASYLHTHLDTRKLKEAKTQLEMELVQNKNWTGNAYLGIIALILLVLAIVIYYQKKQKKLKSKFDILVYKQSIDEIDKAQFTLHESLTQKFISNTSINTLNLLETSQIILFKLEEFEKSKGFLEKITLDDLAIKLSTNRSTLSKVINEFKGMSFTSYIKKLRIDYAVKELTNNPKWHQFTIEALSEEFGFRTSKSFSMAFKEITQIPLHDFLKFRRQQSEINKNRYS